MQVRGPLLSQVPRDPREFLPSSFKYKAWVSTIPGFNDEYIKNWRVEFRKQAYSDASAPAFSHGLSSYDSACLLCSHLLHLGISNSYLSRWLNYRVQHDPSHYDLDGLVDQIEMLIENGRGPAEILVALARPPQEEVKSLQGWLSAAATRDWLASHGMQSPKTLHGGILYESEQWDLDGALLSIAKAIHRLRQRAILKTGKAPVFHGSAWIAGVRNPRRLPATSQLGKALTPGYELGDPQLETHTSEDRLEVAIELLLAALSESGSSTVGTLWAALEALLAAPGDPDRTQVAHRAGDIALVALIRASIQISMGTLFSRCPDENLTQNLGALERRDRLIQFEKALRRDEHETLSHRSTRLMLSHTKGLFDPDSLRMKREELQRALRALYRQRNLVLHGGITDGPLLEDVIRSATPLVAAVVNRYARAIYDGVVDPHLFAYDMFVRIERYLGDPSSVADTFW